MLIIVVYEIVGKLTFYTCVLQPTYKHHLYVSCACIWCTCNTQVCSFFQVGNNQKNFCTTYDCLRSDAGNAQTARSLFSQLRILCVYMEVFCSDLGKNEREIKVAIQFFSTKPTASIESLSRPEIRLGDLNVNLMPDKICSVSS